MRGFPIGFHLRHFPKRRRGQHSVYGNAVGAYVHTAEVRVEQISFAIGPKPSAGDTIRPRRQKWNAVEPRSSTVLKGRQIRRWKVEEILSMHLQLVSTIADGWHD